MIHPVKIYDKHGQLTRIITTDELLEIRERANGKKKFTYRKRFNEVVNSKKQTPGQVAPGEGDATHETERPRNPVRSGRNRGVDDGKCKKILDDKTSFIKSIEDTLKKYLK